jgi:hypothetical protein
MKRDYIDIMWSKALQQAIKEGEEFTRYNFAAIVADAEAKRMHDEGMVTVGHMREQIAAAREAATEEANRRANASWRLMCEKMVAAERAACVQLLRDNAAQCTAGSMNEYILISNAKAIEARGQTIVGFPVVIDESIPPDTFKVVGAKQA